MLGWILSLFGQPAKPVNTSDEALNMAQTAIQQKWPGDYSSYDKQVWYDSELDVWHFRYLREGYSNMFGGIGPGVDIRKSDGKITYLKGQK